MAGRGQDVCPWTGPGGRGGSRSISRGTRREEDFVRILVTGGAGFIGSAYVRRLLDQSPDATVTVLDALTYAGNPSNLEHPNAGGRLTFIKGDISDAGVVNSLVSESD